MNRSFIDFILRMKNTEEVLRHINANAHMQFMDPFRVGVNVSAQRVDEETVLIVYNGEKYILKGTLIEYERDYDQTYEFGFGNNNRAIKYATVMIKRERLQLILPDGNYLDYQMGTREYNMDYIKEYLMDWLPTKKEHTLKEQDEIIEF